MSPKRTNSALTPFLDILTYFLGLMAIVALIMQGFELSPQYQRFSEVGIYVVLYCFVAQEFLRFSLGWFAKKDSSWKDFIWGNLKSHFLERKMEVFVAILMTTLLIAPTSFFIKITTYFIPNIKATTTLTVLLFAFMQFLLFSAQVLKALRNSQLLSYKTLRPAHLFILAFIATILMGTLLLKIPKATYIPISWLDALFTSVSAVCVTGLVVVDTAIAFTPLGKIFLAILFQIGGLGVMTFTMTFSLLFTSALSVNDRMLLADLLSEKKMGQVGNTLKSIAAFTFVLEFIGAILLYKAMGYSFAFSEFKPEAFYNAVFHSISAFCNAGFSLFDDGLNSFWFRSHYFYTSVIMVLVIIGGLGFPVMLNLKEALFSRQRTFLPNLFLTPFTKIVLLSTTGLLLFGAVAIWILESQHSFVNLKTFGEQLYHSLFLSVTVRTAGFNIWPTESLSYPCLFILMFLMWVGGSPISTAGGIKNTTLMVSLINLRSVLVGSPRVLFGRYISMEATLRAFAVIVLSLSFLLVASFLLMWMEPHQPVMDVAFETFSALGTVGLSRGITPELKSGSKVVLMVLMFVGRVGVVAFFMGFFQRKLEEHQKIRFLEIKLPI